MGELQNMLQKTFLGSIAPKVFDDNSQLVYDYELLVHLAEQYEIIDSAWYEGLELLAIADRLHFDFIAQVAGWTYARIRGRGDVDLPEPLIALAKAYRSYREFKGYDPLGDTEFYPEENLKVFDNELESMRKRVTAELGFDRPDKTTILVRRRPMVASEQLKNDFDIILSRASALLEEPECLPEHSDQSPQGPCHAKPQTL